VAIVRAAHGQLHRHHHVAEARRQRGGRPTQRGPVIQHACASRCQARVACMLCACARLAPVRTKGVRVASSASKSHCDGACRRGSGCAARSGAASGVDACARVLSRRASRVRGAAAMAARVRQLSTAGRRCCTQAAVVMSAFVRAAVCGVGRRRAMQVVLPLRRPPPHAPARRILHSTRSNGKALTAHTNRNSTASSSSTQASSHHASSAALPLARLLVPDAMRRVPWNCIVAMLARRAIVQG
jgi:hypothetical protein